MNDIICNYKRRKGKLKLKDMAFPISFLLPSFIVVGIVNIYPLFAGLLYSFKNGSMLNSGNFIGLENYIILFTMPDFLQALRFSAIFAVVSLTGCYVIGMLIALLLNGNIPFRGFFRATLLIPFIVPSVVSVVSWRWLLVSQDSPINHMLGMFGVKPIFFLSDQKWTIAVVCIIKIWKNFPFVALSLLSAMQSISQDVYEAAKIDGANKKNLFYYITLPLLAPVSAVCCIMVTIWSFNDFDIIRMLTNGGPIGATTNIVLLAYNYMFTKYQLGVSSSMAIITLLIIMIFSNFLLKHQDTNK
jgi:ABC-type sugar transport system permease subunit